MNVIVNYVQVRILNSDAISMAAAFILRFIRFGIEIDFK